MTNTYYIKLKISIVTVTTIFFFGCATNPEKLQTPLEPTCVYIKEPLETTGYYGLLKVEWTTRLERGPYWSEKMDDKGIFFRGPPGSVLIRNSAFSSIPGQNVVSDGGFYLPNNINENVKIYRYLTMSDVPIEVPPENTTCSTLAYAKQPKSNKISVMSFAVGGAAAGATSAIVGRNFSNTSNLNYGQTIGTGMVGGAIGGLVISALINSEMGKIDYGQPIKDQRFIEKLRELGAKREHISQIQLMTPVQSEVKH